MGERHAGVAAVCSDELCRDVYGTRQRHRAKRGRSNSHLQHPRADQMHGHWRRRSNSIACHKEAQEAQRIIFVPLVLLVLFVDLLSRRLEQTRIERQVVADFFDGQTEG